MELEDDAPLGADLRDYLALNDHVLDIDLTPNRADCFSVLGIARELSALTKLPPKANSSNQISQPTIDTSLAIRLHASQKPVLTIVAGSFVESIPRRKFLYG